MVVPPRTGLHITCWKLETPRKNIIDNCSLELKLVNSDIEQVGCQKLLGVTIDKHLSFDVHFEELCKKLSQRIAVLRKIRRFTPIQQSILY